MSEPASASAREPNVTEKYTLPESYSRKLSLVARNTGLTKASFVRSLVINFISKTEANAEKAR